MYIKDKAGLDSRLEIIQVALGEQKDYYEIEIVDALEPAHSEILDVEGCPISLRHYVHCSEGPWVILRSTLLNCQHVMPLKSLEGVNAPVGIQSYCINFFRIMKMEEDVDMMLRGANRHAKSRKMYTVEIQVCHLLTDNSNLWINNPSINSHIDQADKEFLFFPIQT